MAILSTLESTTLDEIIRCVNLYFNIKTQNAELINLKGVNYKQPIPLPLTCLIVRSHSS